MIKELFQNEVKKESIAILGCNAFEKCVSSYLLACEQIIIVSLFLP